MVPSSIVFPVYFLFSLYFHFLYLLWIHFHFLCSFSTTSAHSLSSWEAHFSNCCIIHENSVAVFFDQDKWGSFASVQTLVLSVCGLCSWFMGGDGYPRSVNWRCLCVREFDSTWESNTDDRRSVCSRTSNELRLSVMGDRKNSGRMSETKMGQIWLHYFPRGAWDLFSTKCKNNCPKLFGK